MSLRPAGPLEPAAWRALLGVALVAAACLGAQGARAGDALYLNWNDCPGGLGSASNRVFGCGTDAGSERLIAAFSVAQPVDSVIGIEAVVDVQIGAEPLPPWWGFNAGGCRAGSLTAQQDFTRDSTCADPWNDAGVALIQDYLPGEPRGGPGQARIKAVVAVPSTGLVRLEPGTVYYGVRLVISHLFSVACSGCSTPGCLVLNSIWLRRLPGAPGGDVLLETPAPGGPNWARWQSAAQADCLAVPVHRVTWGRLKSFYRP
jgi:hypothetical protein